jgi:hypothetical protein
MKEEGFKIFRRVSGLWACRMNIKVRVKNLKREFRTWNAECRMKNDRE